MGRPFPHKIAHSHGGSGPPSSTWFIGPTCMSPQPNSISIGSAVFAGLTIVTKRPTDRPHYSFCNDRPHLRSTAMRPNKASKGFVARLYPGPPGRAYRSTCPPNAILTLTPLYTALPKPEVSPYADESNIPCILKQSEKNL